MKDSSSKYAVAINFWDALCLMFIYLKLTEKIAWKWLWITCPVWLQFALALILGIAKGFIEARKERKEIQDDDESVQDTGKSVGD